MSNYNVFMDALESNPNIKISDFVDKLTFLSYLTRPVSYSGTTYIDNYENDIFEMIMKSGNMINLQYIIDCGFNVNHNNFGDYGSLFQIALANSPNYETLKKQLKLLIQNNFDVNNFTLNEDETHCDDLWPNLLFYIYSYSSINKKFTDDELNKLVSLLEEFGVDPHMKNILGQKYDDDVHYYSNVNNTNNEHQIVSATIVIPSAPYESDIVATHNVCNYCGCKCSIKK